MALASNLPPAAGVSSSSALVVGLTLAVSALNDLSSTVRWQDALVPRTKLAGYIGALENGLDFGSLAGERGVGTLGGAQDQTAILCCAPGKLDVFGWAPVRHERDVSWPDDHVFVVGVSGVVAAKTGAVRERYNRVARDAANEEFTTGRLEARLRQFHAETWQHVPRAAAALSSRDLGGFSSIVAASQRGAEAALENQIPETIQLVGIARELGAVASSAFGAGFGGSVWAMVPQDEAERFGSRWRDRYLKLYPQAASRMQVFETRPSAPAFESV
jgi:galactokinase